MSIPNISIITPTYNAAAYIAATINSVLSQTYTNWEWIIVDDGSSDATVKYIKNINDPRIKLICSQHSGLPAVARNIGLQAMRGELVAFLDADDLWEPDKLAAQVRYLEVFSDVGLVFSQGYLWFDRRSRPQGIVPKGYSLPNPGSMLHSFCLRNWAATSSVVVKHSLLKAHGTFDEDPRQRGTEDYELWLRLAAHTSFGFVEKPLYWYRVHTTNLSSGEVAILEGRLLALEKTFRNNPELSSDPRLAGTIMAAQKLAWRGYAQLRDCVEDCGRQAFIRSLRIQPLNREVWLLFMVSCLGSPLIRQLKRLLRWIG